MKIDLTLEENITLVQVYAPTNDNASNEKDEFYEQLTCTVEKAKDKNRKVIIMGDLNGRVGCDPESAGGVIGRHNGESAENEGGRRLIEFCQLNNMLIGNTFFIHKTIHKITFEGTGREANSIIDYFIYDTELRYGFNDIKVIRGAELSTDHRLLVSDTKFRKSLSEKHKTYKAIKKEELLKVDKQQEFKDCLETCLHSNTNNNLDVKWVEVKEALINTAKET